MFACLFVCLLVCLFLGLLVCLLLGLFMIHWFVYVFYSFIYVFICLSICLSVPSMHPTLSAGGRTTGSVKFLTLIANGNQIQVCACVCFSELLWLKGSYLRALNRVTKNMAQQLSGKLVKGP